MKSFPPDAAALVESWLQQRPEHRLTRVFFQPPLERTWAWMAWLHMMQESLFAPAESPVCMARAVFWGEELARCAQQAPRHPLSAYVLAGAASFDTQACERLAQQYPNVVQTFRDVHDAPSDVPGLLAPLEPLAAWFAQCAQVFGWSWTQEDLRLDLLRHALSADAAEQYPLAWPLDWLFGQKKHNTSEQRQALRAELAKTCLAQPQPVAADRARRIENHLQRHHLNHIAHSHTPQPLSGLPLLINAWRAARHTASA